MVIRFINDWQYFFRKTSIGGRFSAFTFFNVAFMKIGEPLIDGFTLIIFGLGFRISKRNKGDKHGA